MRICSTNSGSLSRLVDHLHLAAMLLAPSVNGGFGLFLLWWCHFIMRTFQLHFFLSFWSITSCPLFNQRHRFLCLHSMAPCSCGLLVGSLYLVAPLLVPLVDGICVLLVKPRSLFTRRHHFLHLWLMASGDFGRIAASLQLFVP